MNSYFLQLSSESLHTSVRSRGPQTQHPDSAEKVMCLDIFWIYFSAVRPCLLNGKASEVFKQHTVVELQAFYKHKARKFFAIPLQQIKSNIQILQKNRPEKCKDQGRMFAVEMEHFAKSNLGMFPFESVYCLGITALKICDNQKDMLQILNQFPFRKQTVSVQGLNNFAASELMAWSDRNVKWKKFDEKAMARVTFNRMVTQSKQSPEETSPAAPQQGFWAKTH